MSMRRNEAIGENVLAVLAACRVEGPRLYLPPTQLERNLYVAVNDVLTRLGGKWQGGKVKAHVFASDPGAKLAEVLGSGYKPAKNALAFFATPRPVVGRMLRLIPHATRILEPSAGTGAILAGILEKFPGASVEALELDTGRYQELMDRYGGRVTIHASDFLNHSAAPYDAIAMNPPFAVERDAYEYVTHITHAYSLLAHGGALVAIAPAGLIFTNNVRRVASLRELIEGCGRIDELPDGAFDESGTQIHAVLAYMVKP